MTTAALNNLLTYLQGLSLTQKNKEWLAKHLIEPKTQEGLPLEIAAIPEQYRVDPYLVSPSGDPYWADRRNVEGAKRAMTEADEEMKTGKLTPINLDDLWK